MSKPKKQTTLWLCVTAMFMALNVIMSSFGIPVPGGHLYLCDVVICTAALLLDPFGAFMVGGVGSFIGDMLFYPAAMFVSLITHGLQAAVISYFAHHVSHKRPLLPTIIGLIIGSVIMVTGYSLGTAFVYGTPGAVIPKLPHQLLQAVVGAAGGLFLCRKCGLDKVFTKYL